MKKLLVLLSALWVVVGLFPIQANAQYAANSVLGQFEPGLTASFTNGYEDGVGAINGYNFSEAFKATVFDATRNRLYVSDTSNDRILVYETNVAHDIPFGESADYVLGVTNFVTVGGGSAQNRLDAPRGLALDETNGRLFVADSSNARVVIYDVSGAITNGMNASNYLSSSVGWGFSSNGFSYRTDALNGFTSPTDVAYDPNTNYLYVIDQFLLRVTVFDVAAITNGEAAFALLGGDAGSSSLGVTPTSLAIDSAGGRLFVGDNAKNRVLVYDVNTVTTYESPANVLGQPDFSTTTGGLGIAKIPVARGMDYNSTNSYLAVAQDSGRVSIFDTASISNGEDAIYVLGAPDFDSLAGSPSLAGSTASYDAYWQDSTTLLVIGKARLMEFDTTSITNGEDAVNILGQFNIITNTITTDTEVANGGNQLTGAGLDNPIDVLVDTENNRLYVADQDNNRVLIYNLDATTKEPVDNVADNVLGATSFTSIGDVSGYAANNFQPFGLALDVESQLLYVSDYWFNRILVFDVNTITNGEDAINVIGQPDFATDDYNGPTATDMELPGHMAFNQQDKWLFVNDPYYYRVLIFDMSGGITDDMAASKVLGQSDMTSQATGLTQSRFDYLEGEVDYDETTRNLYVSDPYANRILVFTMPSDLASLSNGANADYVVGQADFTSNDGSPQETRMDTPYGVTVGPDNNLYVYDCYNFRIFAYDVTTLANDPTPIGVIGQADFSGISSVLSPTQYTILCDFADGSDYDPVGNRLYIADADNNRVLSYEFVDITTTTLPDATVDQAYSQDLSTQNEVGTVDFSLMSGTLPTGISISSVVGTPTTAGTYNFKVKATDTIGAIGEFFTGQSYTLTINSAAASPTPTPTPSPSPTASPTPTPTPAVTAGAPQLSSPSGGSNVGATPAFSWNAPAEPGNVSTYSLVVDGSVLYSGLSSTSSSETDDYIFVYDSSSHSYILQLKKPLNAGAHTWLVQAVSTTGQVTESETRSFTIGSDSAGALTSEEALVVPPSSPIPFPSAVVQTVDDFLTVEDSQVESGVSVDVAEQVQGLVTSLGQVLASIVEVLKPAAPTAPALATGLAVVVTTGLMASQLGGSLFSPKIFVQALQALGFFAQGNPQGVIFDATNYSPIPFALITLSNKDQTQTDTVVTDVNGLYRGVHLPKGEYKIMASHQSFSFPTKKAKPEYLTDREFYKGQQFGVSSEKNQQLFLIPMDGIEAAKGGISLKHRASLFFSWLLRHQDYITGIFFGISILMTWLAPNPINILLTLLYGLLVGKQLVAVLRRPLVSGSVTAYLGRPVEGTIIRFIDIKTNQLRAVAQSDKSGWFKAFIEPGRYQVAVSKLGFTWDDAGAAMSLVERSFTQPTKLEVKLNKAQTANLGNLV